MDKECELSQSPRHSHTSGGNPAEQVSMTDEAPDCRALGKGHFFRKFSETETDILYVCEFCGREMFEDKKTINLIKPERQHGNAQDH